MNKIRSQYKRKLKSQKMLLMLKRMLYPKIVSLNKKSTLRKISGNAARSSLNYFKMGLKSVMKSMSSFIAPS